MQLQPTDALLVIDVQNDFMPGGALAVTDGDAIVPLINTLAKKFDHVILTQDWHPPQHISFATTHNKQPFETIRASQRPPNPLARTRPPAHRRRSLPPRPAHPPRRTHPPQRLPPPHRQLLRLPRKRPPHPHRPRRLPPRAQPQRLFLCGLAYDFCVRYSAIDGHNLGFETIVIEDATRPVNLPNSVAETNAALAAANILRIHNPLT